MMARGSRKLWESVWEELVRQTTARRARQVGVVDGAEG